MSVQAVQHHISHFTRSSSVVPVHNLQIAAGDELLRAIACGQSGLAIRAILQARQKHLISKDLFEALSLAAQYRKMEIVYELLCFLHPPFASCANLQAIMDQLFPLHRELTDLSNVYPCPAFEELSAVYQKPCVIPEIGAIQGLSLKELIQFAKDNNPVFARALEIGSVPIFAQQLKGKDSFYSYDTHKIYIDPGKTAEQQLDALYFEVANALQRKSLQKLAQSAKDGRLGREEYAAHFAWIESGSAHWCECMHACWGNRSALPVRSVHRDRRRLEWTEFYFASYLAQHRDLIHQFQIRHSQTPGEDLLRAATQNDTSWVIGLLNNHPRIDASAAGSALCAAAEIGSSSIVRAILRLRRDLYYDQMVAALFTAASLGFGDTVKALFDSGFRPSTNDLAEACARAAQAGYRIQGLKRK